MLQHNVNKSRSRVMIPLFESEGITDFDILAIQEPWRNLHQPTTNNRLNQHFELHYMNDKNIRVCFFVNRRIAFASYTITHRSKDLCSLTLRLVEGRTINVHNIYNSCKDSENGSNLPLLRTTLAEKANEEHIVTGDFNLHHPKWGGDEVRADTDAYELVVMTEEFRRKRTLPKGTITWRQGSRQSTIDLPFVSQILRESLIECGVAENMDSHSDHYPKRTIFDLHTVAAKPIEKRNWDKTNAVALQKILNEGFTKELALTPANDVFDKSKNGLDAQVGSLARAIKAAIEVSTPLTRICPKFKAGFTKECNEASREAKRHRRTWQRSGSDEDWKEYTMARNRLGKVVQKAMKIQFKKNRRRVVNWHLRCGVNANGFAQERRRKPAFRHCIVIHRYYRESKHLAKRILSATSTGGFVGYERLPIYSRSNNR